ncbi:MAG: hypothetical protein ACI9SP_003265 [Arenicella sp.]|jgi:hypothetical protein
MNRNHTIKIATDFHETPSGRFRLQGDFTGQHFREDILVPALKRYEKVTVVLDEVAGFGSSFLEEVFGGLIRLEGFSYEDLDSRIELISEEDPSYIDEIKEYLRSARDN